MTLELLTFIYHAHICSIADVSTIFLCSYVRFLTFFLIALVYVAKYIFTWFFFFFFERDLYLVLLKGLLDVLNNVFVFWPSPGYLSVSCLQHRYIIINLQWDFVLGKGSSLVSCKKILDFKLTLGFGFKASRLSKKTH